QQVDVVRDVDAVVVVDNTAGDGERARADGVVMLEPERAFTQRGATGEGAGAGKREDAAAELHETARARDDAAENPVAVFLPDFKFSAAEIDRAASTGERRDGEIEIV